MNNSTWINLDESLSKSNKASKSRNNRHKRIRRDIQSKEALNIEDDSSEENDPYEMNMTSTSRQMKPLTNITVCDDDESSGESVEYNPDGTQLPITSVKYTLKPILSTSKSTTIQRQLSTETPSTSTLHSSNWKTFPKAFVENDNLTDSILEFTDSDESNTLLVQNLTSIPNDVSIDECSTESLQSQSLNANETRIETQESITPPAEPVELNKLPKKRKVRCVKGGMVERLTKCLSKSKSDVLFWQHHRSAELISPGTFVKIERVENTYGQILLHTKLNDTATIFSLGQGTSTIQKDDIVEVKFDSRRGYSIDTRLLYSYIDKILRVK